MMTESVVFLHGFAGSPRAWDLICHALPAELPRECMTLSGHETEPAISDGVADSSRGQWTAEHGTSMHEVSEDGFALDREAIRILDRCKELNLKGIHLIGYSLGARIALSMLLQTQGLGGICDGIELPETGGTLDRVSEPFQKREAERMRKECQPNPELIARATLIGVNPGLRSLWEREQRWRVDQGWASLAEAASLEAFLARWEAQPLLALTGEEAVEQQRAQRVWRNTLSGTGLAGALRAFSLAHMHDTRQQWAKVSVPVTLIAGQNDARYVALSQELASLLPQAECVLVPECGHNVVLEHPEVIVQQILAHDGR